MKNYSLLLDKSQDEAYEDVQTAEDKVKYLDLNDSFIYGFHLGLMLVVEVYNTSDDFIVGGV